MPISQVFNLPSSHCYVDDLQFHLPLRASGSDAAQSSFYCNADTKQCSYEDLLHLNKDKADKERVVFRTTCLTLLGRVLERWHQRSKQPFCKIISLIQENSRFFLKRRHYGFCIFSTEVFVPFIFAASA